MDETRKIYYDKYLNIEASKFIGVIQDFPMHFHEHYTIGFIEKGKMKLNYKSKEYIANKGDLLLFNPYDSHSCSDINGEVFSFSSINIDENIMLDLVSQMADNNILPCFNSPINFHSPYINKLIEIYMHIICEENPLYKEEKFILLIKELLSTYSNLELSNIELNKTKEISKVCRYINENYKENISLDTLSNIVGISKFHFIRLFSKEKGITPYKYLETVRINNAKRLLKKGLSPVNVAIETGFNDQSHLNKLFKKVIGVTPKQYKNIYI